MDYPFQSIQLNDREIPISAIVSGHVKALNDFEFHTLEFIRDWYNGREKFLLTTSGSTGEPKPISITRTQMIASAVATANALSLQGGGEALICLDTRYIAGKMMLVRCFISGLHIRAVTPTANPLWNVGWGKNIHFVALVPYQLHAILESEERTKLDSIENIIVGGAPLTSGDLDRLSSYSCNVFLTYGMTETISHIALKRLNPKVADAFYKTLPGITVETDDRECLIIDCPYIRDKVVTNDIVRLIDSSTFMWLGRFDNVINSGGIKIHPEKLEDEIGPIIKGLNLHARFLISSVPDLGLGERLVLILETDRLEDSQKSKIIEELAKLLPRFKVPKDIYTVVSLPETENGKINRRQLKNLLSKRQ
jgi:o-succinylbenzoate---CoA ligase